MGAKKKDEKKKKKAKIEAPHKHDLPDFDKLMNPPELKWTAELDPRIDKDNPNEGNNFIIQCSKSVKGSTQMDYSFNKIKEQIQDGFGHSFGNLILFRKDDVSGDWKQIKEELYQPISKYFKPEAEGVKFLFDFIPFVSPTLEASVALAKETEEG